MTTVPAEQTSSKHEERWFAARLLLLFVVVLAGFFGLMAIRGNITSSKYPRVKLPDGSWLVARQVSVGKNHAIEVPYTVGAQFRRWQRSYKQPHTTSEDRTVIWLTRENDRGDRLDLDWLKRVELDNGDPHPLKPKQYHRQTIQPNSGSGSGTGASGFDDAKPFGSATPVEIALIHLEFPLLRPRDGKMGIKVFDGADKLVAELPLAYVPLPNLSTEQWQPDPLPASRTDGNVTVTLNSMEFFTIPDMSGLYVRPQLTFVHDGQPSQTWGASEEFHDLLGNKAYSWGVELSPSESAWKLKLTMSQMPNGRFLPDETLKLPLRPLTANRQLDAVSEKHTINGITVSLLGLGGQGPLDFTLPSSTSHFKTGAYQSGRQSYGMTTSCNNNKCEVEFASGNPFIVTSDNRGQSDASIQFVFRDQNGEVLEQRGTSGTEGLSFWFFEPKATTTSIEVEIIAQKNRHAEFLIAPPTPDQIKARQ